jgi:arylsulfatase A-like enzyme
VAALALAGTLGCGAATVPAGPETVLDLVSAFPATGAAGPTVSIDVADAAGRLHLVKGWSAPETAASGMVVWAGGTRASLWFFAGRAPVEQTLVVRAVAPDTGGRLALVLVRANGRTIGRIRLRAGEQEPRVVLTAAHQRPGRNVLEFMLPGGWSRSAARGRPVRRFGIRSLHFEPNRSPPAAPSAGHERLRLPRGTSATYVFEVPPGARFVYEPERGIPAVSIEVPSQPARVLTAGGQESPVSIDLGPEGGTFARLTVRAPGTGDDVILRRPRVEAPRSPQKAPTAIARPAPRHPNVLLYVADTLRADRLGCYGYTRPTSPNLDRFAREGVLYEHAIGQASWTRPATASILTGRQPYEHGATSLMDAIRPDVPTMAELLSTRGYRSAAFVTNLNVAARFGFGRGFEDFHHLEEREDRHTVYAPASELNQWAFAWLDRNRTGPFFLYLHATDTHAPYRPPPEYAARFARAGPAPTIQPGIGLRGLFEDPQLATPENIALLASLYDGEVAFLDAAFGDLLTKLDALRLTRSTLVVFVADHGEEFREHGGLDHGRTLYQEMVHVPLIVRLPGAYDGGRRVRSLVRHIDILPTVLALLGIDPPALPGAPLPPAETVATGTAEAVIETELTGRRLTGLVTRGWKAVWSDDRPDEGMELYALATDPAETRNLAREHPVVAAYARQQLARQRLVAPAPPDTAVFDPTTERRLRALGYVE